jgi:hypothetical protein
MIPENIQEWNGLLLEHCFNGTGSIRRFDATPQFLANLTGLDQAASYFVGTIVEDLEERTFESRVRQLIQDWDPDIQPPSFFGHLWFTSLVAHGYPNANDTFYNNIQRLFNRYMNFSPLPDFWRALADWSKKGGRPVLLLPKIPEYMKNIGFSVYLAFPNVRDARALRKAFQKAGFLGDEPPLLPGIEAIRGIPDTKLSPIFRDEFKRAIDTPPIASSAFWSAISDLCENGESVFDQTKSPHNNIELLAFADVEGVTYFVGSNDSKGDKDYHWQPLEETVAGFNGYLVHKRDEHTLNPDGPVKDILETRLNAGKSSVHIRRGAVLFIESSPGQFYPASSGSISHATLALVRTDLSTAFIRHFGGRSIKGPHKNWVTVYGCNCHNFDELPGDLPGIYHVCTGAPRISLTFIGGVRTVDGFLAVPELMPRIGTPHGWTLCLPEEFGPALSVREGEWVLPEIVQIPIADDSIEIPLSLREDATGEFREDVTSIRFNTLHFSCDYKPLAKSQYSAEGLKTAEITFESREIQTAPVPLSDGLRDMLQSQEDVWFVGQRRGEFDRYKKSNLWALVKPASKGAKPKCVILVGNPEKCKPIAADSTRRDMRQLWRNAFKRLNTPYVLIDREYVRAQPGSAAMKAWDEYAAIAKRNDLPLDRFIPAPRVGNIWSGCNPGNEVGRLETILAALGCRRGGIPYREFIDVFQDIVQPESGTQHDILRSWIEAGTIDIVRKSGWARIMVQLRRPQIILFSVGPLIRGAVLGLLAPSSSLELEAVAANLGIESSRRLPRNPKSPAVITLEGKKVSEFESLCATLGLNPPSFIAWPDKISIEKWKSTGVFDQEPKADYTVQSGWNWNTGRFDQYKVESSFTRSWAPQRGTIYELRDPNNEVKAWTRHRNPAALLAYTQWGNRSLPYYRDREVIRRQLEGHSVYLPLYVGRLCSVAGYGVPGRYFGSELTDARNYEYPLGYTLARSIAIALNLPRSKGKKNG